MKDIRAALRTFLLGDPLIVAAIINRIYTMRLPQGIKVSSIVMTRISGPGDYHLQGPSGFIAMRMQVDSWATTADAASALANLVNDRIDGYKGDMGTGANIISVAGVFVADLREDYDDEAQLYRCGRDYFIHHQELS